MEPLRILAILAITALCKTKDGVELLDNNIDGVDSNCISIAVINLLSFVGWIHDANSKDEIQNL